MIRCYICVSTGKCPLSEGLNSRYIYIAVFNIGAIARTDSQRRAEEAAEFSEGWKNHCVKRPQYIGWRFSLQYEEWQGQGATEFLDTLKDPRSEGGLFAEARQDHLLSYRWKAIENKGSDSDKIHNGQGSGRQEIAYRQTGTIHVSHYARCVGQQCPLCRHKNNVKWIISYLA